MMMKYIAIKLALSCVSCSNLHYPMSIYLSWFCEQEVFAACQPTQVALTLRIVTVL